MNINKLRFGPGFKDDEIPVDRTQRVLVGGEPETSDHREINPETGMQKAYVVLTKEERRKGFVRPVRHSYVHKGKRPKYPMRPLTKEEHERYDKFGYVWFEEYPKNEENYETGKYWTKEEVESGCGRATKMNQEIAETYARDPKFYDGTFCMHCRKHLPLDEFVWLDNPDQQVGS